MLHCTLTYQYHSNSIIHSACVLTQYIDTIKRFITRNMSLFFNQCSMFSDFNNVCL